MPSISKDLLDELIRHGTSTLCEAAGLACAFDVALRPVWPGAVLAGPAFPVRCAAGDNLAIHYAVAEAGAGDVLVIDGMEFIGGYWGEVLAVAAQARGIAGLVIDGGVRDIDALERRKFPVFARGIGMRGCVKAHAPSVGEPTVVAGVSVARGDMVVADADGAMAIARGELERTLAAARQRTEKEVLIMQRLEKGETTLKILGLPARGRAKH